MPVPGYREEPGVAPDSRTETYVALKSWVDNWRWEGTPFYLRTGKRLPKQSTEIAIQFRVAPHQLFSRDALAGLEPNALVLRIQPDEGISLRFGAKVPVQGIRIRAVNMDFDYGASFMVDAPDAYETLILDALREHDEIQHRRARDRPSELAGVSALGATEPRELAFERRDAALSRPPERRVDCYDFRHFRPSRSMSASASAGPQVPAS